MRNSETETGFNVRAHYRLGRVPLPPPRRRLGIPLPKYPATLPDIRSLFMGYYYGFSRLPQNPHAAARNPSARRLFHGQCERLPSNPDKREPRSRYIIRWRLEKKDPTAALSEPSSHRLLARQRTSPRLTARRCLMAFSMEQGLREDRVQERGRRGSRGDDDDFDTSATRCVDPLGIWQRHPVRRPWPEQRWTRAPARFSMPTSRMNGDITRLYSARVAEDPPRPVGSAWPAGLIRNSGELCTYADNKLSPRPLSRWTFLVARGDFEYGSPQAEAWIMDAIKDITAH